MLNQDLHPTAQELLRRRWRTSRSRAVQVRAHLAACWGCRNRMAEMEAAIAGSRGLTDRPSIPNCRPLPAAGAIAGATRRIGSHTRRSWRGLFQFTPAMRAAAVLCAVVVTAAVAGALLLQHSVLGRGDGRCCSAGASRGSRPQPYAGSHAQGYGRDVCSMSHEEVVRDVPTAVRQRFYTSMESSKPARRI